MFQWREWLQKQPPFILFLSLGLLLTLIGGWIMWQGGKSTTPAVEIIEEKGETQELVVEVGGAVEKPGVYHFKNNARVNDALVLAGGLSAGADRKWVEQYLNRASQLTDGQKIYIPEISKQSEVLSANNSGGDQTISTPFSSYQQQQGSSTTKMVNINTATLSELDTLPGIGQVYGGKIIEQRPYSNIEELLSKKVVPQSTYNKIKGLVSVY